VKRLLLECGGSCAFPGCNRQLVSPDSSLESGAVIAELAHIVADSREGPRGGSSLTEAERNRHDNLIVLCPEHHKVIDSQPNTFSIQVLRQMKLDHLAQIQSRLHPETSAVATPKLITEQIQSTLLRVSHLGLELVIADPHLGEFAADESFTLELLELLIPPDMRSRLPIGGWRKASLRILIALPRCGAVRITEEYSCDED
jgi:hypothetical protein